MNWIRHGRNSTFESVSHFCRIMRQDQSNVRQKCGSRCRRRISAALNSLNWIRHGRNATYEPGLKLYNFIPDFSNPRFLETPDKSNKFWLQWDKLTPDNSNLRKFPNQLVRMSIPFTPLRRWLYILFFKGLNFTCMCINILFWQMLANHRALGRRSIITSYSVRLHIDSFRTLMLFLWQLLIETLGLFCESYWLLDGVSRFLHGEFSVF